MCARLAAALEVLQKRLCHRHDGLLDQQHRPRKGLRELHHLRRAGLKHAADGQVEAREEVQLPDEQRLKHAVDAAEAPDELAGPVAEGADERLGVAPGAEEAHGEGLAAGVLDTVSVQDDDACGDLYPAKKGRNGGCDGRPTDCAGGDAVPTASAEIY